MQFKVRSLVCAILGATLAASAARADEVEGLITFTAGTPAKASEVNDNFAAVKTAVDGTHVDVVALQQALAELQEAVAALQSENATLTTALGTLTTELAATEASVAALEAENSVLSSEIGALTSQLAVLETDNATFASQLDGIFGSQIWALNPYLTVTGGQLPNVRLSGVNLQIVNGPGVTSEANGLGNLIVGYNEVATFIDPFCSNANYPDPINCELSGGVWGTSHRTGSHYVVVGRGHSYSKYGGIVAGWSNASTGLWASVLGGAFNKAMNDYASVTGGNLNEARALYSTVSGGYQNKAREQYSTVSGGRSLEATHNFGWIAGSTPEQY